MEVGAAGHSEGVDPAGTEHVSAVRVADKHRPAPATFHFAFDTVSRVDLRGNDLSPDPINRGSNPHSRPSLPIKPACIHIRARARHFHNRFLAHSEFPGEINTGF
jgi:hypothetical protein